MTTEQLKDLEATLWSSADTLRANSDLKSSEYATPVLGLIFLKFADNKYSRYEAEIEAEFKKLQGSRRETPINTIAVEKCGFYLPPEARYDYLLDLPEEADIAKAIKSAMQLIEEYKPELKGVLPQDEYFALVRKPEFRIIPKQLLKNFADIPADADGDLFGQIYEYFLGRFAMAEGQGGGEFFTPRSVVRLMVEMIEPHHGTVFDPACGSGGMFVQSAQFVGQRRSANEDRSLFVYGQEKTLETVKLAKMNIAVNGLRGEIRQANTYSEDPFGSIGKFDYVLANPPFNVDQVNLAQVEQDPRFNTYGIPRNKTKKKDKGTETVPNANYLWINLFATSLNEQGRAGLVMANSASDARHSEAEIRRNLIEHNLIYGMVSLPTNMFYTVTLPATLWFFDKAKQDERILFIDARNVFTQIDRAHREFSPEQIRNLALISKLHKGRSREFTDTIDSYFESGFNFLQSNRDKLDGAAASLRDFIKANGGGEAPDFKPVLRGIDKLLSAYQEYSKGITDAGVEETNSSQQRLAAQTAPFFQQLHELLKQVDKQVRRMEKEQNRNRELKQLKEQLDELHREIKDAEYFFSHINWLQERFPEAVYQDVTGLCKLASLEEVKEQEYSLNPGRYVGVVIEEDGKTEEEFIAEMLDLHDELEQLNSEAHALEAVIAHNIRQIAGEK